MRKLIAVFGFLTVVGLAAPRQTSAAPLLLTLAGVNDPSLGATALLTYDPLLALLSLDITNTSALYDPRVTSFGFNTPTAVTGISSFLSSPAGWTYSFNLNGINTPGQFGFYDAASLTGPNFNGGKPNLGIAIGNTNRFEFTFSGNNLGSLTEASFLNLSYDPAGGPQESQQAFIARFQRVGLDGNGSDVAIVAVPEPATVTLTGLGLLVLAAHRRRRHA